MYQLIKLPEHSIITTGDDFHCKTLRSNDFAYHWRTKEVLTVLEYNSETGSWKCSDGTNRDSYKLKKIIAGLPDQPQIDYSLLSEDNHQKIGWIDIEKLAKDRFKPVIPSGLYDDGARQFNYSLEDKKQRWIDAVKFGLELSENKFNLDDIKRVVELSRKEHDTGNGTMSQGYQDMKYTYDDLDIINIITYPKVYDIEIEMEKDWVQEFRVGRDLCDVEFVPKIYDNILKITKIN